MTRTATRPVNRIDPLLALQERPAWDGASLRPIGTSYKLHQSHFAQDVVSAATDELQINQSEMSASLVFADGQRRDRVGDLIEIPGIQTVNHRFNPVVLLDHGKHFHLPIAMAEDRRTKEYTVRLDPVRAIASAVTFFSQRLLEAEQIFHLVVEKMIRAGSIGYRPIKALQLYADQERGIPAGMHLLITELLELSWVVIPANADTVRKMLAMPACCGKALSPCIRTALEPYNPGQLVWINGATWETKSINDICKKYRKNVSYSPAVASAMRKKKRRELAYGRRSPENIGKGTTMPADIKREVKGAPDGMVSDDRLPSPKEVEEGMQKRSGAGANGQKQNDGQASTDGKGEKYSAQVIRRIHSDYGILIEDYDEFVSQCEDDDVLAHLKEDLEFLTERRDKLEAIFKEKHGDLPGLEGAEESDDEEDEDDSAVDDEDDDAEDDDDEDDEEISEVETKGLPSPPVLGKGICATCKSNPCKCGKKSMPETSFFTDEHRGHIDGASKFLGEMGADAGIGEDRQSKCMHYHKALGGMITVKNEDCGDGHSEGGGENAAPSDAGMETKEADTETKSIEPENVNYAEMIHRKELEIRELKVKALEARYKEEIGDEEPNV